MGCGSSKTGDTEAAPDSLQVIKSEEKNDVTTTTGGEEEKARQLVALLSRISEALGLPAAHPDVTQYGFALDSGGWDTPDAFDDLTIEELKVEFNFKPGHLKRVSVCRCVCKCAGVQV